MNETRRAWVLTLTALVFLVGAPRVSRAECPPETAGLQAVQNIGTAVNQVQQVLANCKPKSSAERPGAEQAELDALKDKFRKGTDAYCESHSCVGNVNSAWAWGKFWGEKPMYGCGSWAYLVHDILVPPASFGVSYHTVGIEQRCDFPGHCHWVTLVRNERTGVITVFDGWARHGGWVFGGDTGQDGIYSHQAFIDEWGDDPTTYWFERAMCQR